MAHNSIFFENPNTGLIKEAPVGFSWTTFFFGGIVALIRGDIKWGLVQMLIQFFTFGFSSMVWGFFYNKLFINELISQGYKIKSVSHGTLEYICQELGINEAAHKSNKTNASSNGADNLVKLEKLHELKNKGAITEEEYALQKSKLIA